MSWVRVPFQGCCFGPFNQGGDDMPGGDIQSVAMNTAINSMTDGNAYLLQSSGSMSVSLTNPSTTNSMSAMLVYRAPSIELSHDGFSGGFAGQRNVSISDATPAIEQSGFDIDTDGAIARGQSSVFIQEFTIVAMSDNLIPPSGSMSFGIDDQISLDFGDGNPHDAFSLGQYSLVGVGIVVA